MAVALMSYVKPAHFKKRNAKLIADIKAAIGERECGNCRKIAPKAVSFVALLIQPTLCLRIGEVGFDDFAHASAQFRDDMMSANRYFERCATGNEPLAVMLVRFYFWACFLH